ncbi:MAG: thioredoxin-disulfide reductase [Holosporales bacterium]|jgi:thioredoxin reductase (NADPH)|nr:thioredoxin-disulfide reductase [Holosporales bacterium]
MNDVINCAIVGAGPAGLTTAIYLARSGMTPLVISGDKPGGQLVNTDMVENYPGFESIRGVDLMMSMLTQAEKLGTKFEYESVDKISLSRGIFESTLSSGKIIKSKTIIIATGAKHRHLFVPGEEVFTNKGVSWCATCDGPMYKGKKVAVIGGGNTAAMEALFLSNLASEVLLIHRRDSLRAEKVTQEKLFAKANIKCIWDSVVTEILGDSRVTSIGLKNIVSNEEITCNVDGVFVAIGTTPQSAIVKELVGIDDDGYIIAENTKTSCPGLFAAGDVVSGSLKQAIYAAGQGAFAAKCIEGFLGIC